MNGESVCTRDSVQRPYPKAGAPGRPSIYAADPRGVASANRHHGWATHPLCLALLRVGVASQPSHPGCWCALTAPFHPYLARSPRRPTRGGLLSVARPTAHTALTRISTLPVGVPTFLSNVSLPTPRRGRPTDSPFTPDPRRRLPRRSGGAFGRTPRVGLVSAPGIVSTSGLVWLDGR
jgi:hypothetical protein